MVEATWGATGASSTYGLADELLFSRHELWPSVGAIWAEVMNGVGLPRRSRLTEAEGGADSNSPDEQTLQHLVESEAGVRVLVLGAGEGEVPVWLIQRLHVSELYLLPCPAQVTSISTTPPASRQPSLSPAQRLRHALQPSKVDDLVMLSPGCQPPLGSRAGLHCHTHEQTRLKCDMCPQNKP